MHRVLSDVIITPCLRNRQFVSINAKPKLPNVPLSVIHPRTRFALLSDLNGHIHFLHRIRRRLGLRGVRPMRDEMRRFPSRPPFSNMVDHTFTSLGSVID